MARRFAARRDDNEAAIVLALQQVGASVYRLDESGVPDLLVGWCKKMFLMEVKGAKGTLTKRQKEFRRDWKGPPAVVVRDVHEALGVLGALADRTVTGVPDDWDGKRAPCAKAVRP